MCHVCSLFAFAKLVFYFLTGNDSCMFFDEAA